jgi:hypothetical protein
MDLDPGGQKHVNLVDPDPEHWFGSSALVPYLVQCRSGSINLGSSMQIRIHQFRYLNADSKFINFGTGMVSAYAHTRGLQF